MKIGIDARMLGYSGIGRYTENLIRELLKIDKKNEYVVFVQKNLVIRNTPIESRDVGRATKFVTNNEQRTTKNEIPNLKIIEINAPIYSFKEQYNFLLAVNKEKLDIMHFTHFNRPILYNRASITTIHDLTPIYFPGKKHKSLLKQFAYRLVLKKALERSSKIIAVSNFTKKDIIKYFPDVRDKIVVIYEGIETRFERNPKFEIQNSKQTLNLKCKISKPYILYVGIWREHKNLLGLIKAFEKIKTEILASKLQITNSKLIKNLKLVIVGKPDPYYPEIEEAQKNSKFKKDIILTGYVEDSDLPVLYQNAEAFVFPSFYEGFGFPPLEAMAMGCPVVCSNAASLPEILGDAALYFNPYNIEDMANKIIQLLCNENLKKCLIRKGWLQVQKYSFQKMAKETLMVYNSLKSEIQNNQL